MSSEGDNDGYDELPSFVREALSDYSDESVWLDPYFESYDITRFDDSIYGVDETEPRALMFQQIARELRFYISEEDDREQVRVQDLIADLTDLTNQLQVQQVRVQDQITRELRFYIV